MFGDVKSAFLFGIAQTTRSYLAHDLSVSELKRNAAVVCNNMQYTYTSLDVSAFMCIARGAIDIQQFIKFPFAMFLER